VPTDISLEGVGAVAEAIRRRGDKTPWLLGDLWNGIPRRHGDGPAIAAALGRNHQSCMNAGWVAAKFPETSRHREKLEFGHFEAVAALKTARERKRFLDLCEKHDWAVVKLRDEIREKTHPRRKGPGPEPTNVVHLRTDPASTQPQRPVVLTVLSPGSPPSPMPTLTEFSPVTHLISQVMVVERMAAEVRHGPPVAARDAKELVERLQSALASAEEIRRKATTRRSRPENPGLVNIA
jgi:hypothetical protein